MCLFVVTPIKLVIPFASVTMIIKTKKTPQIGMLPSSIHIPNSIRVTTKNDEVGVFSGVFLTFFSVLFHQLYKS